MVYMASKFKWALTPNNVAAIGAIDDFYDLYVYIQEVYEEQSEQFFAAYGNKRYLRPDMLDELCRKQVRKLCEPVMNKYLHIFADEYDKIFANAYGFATFSFYNWKGVSRANQPGIIRYSEISFADFLIEFQYAISRIIHSWKTKTQPKYAFDRLSIEINDHVLSYIQCNTVIEALPIEDATPTTDAILYIYETLTSTYCSINKHPITEARYVANSVVGTDKIVLPVHYCSKCKKYFIGEITLKLFEKNYGKLLIEKRKLTDAGDTFSAFNPESRLFQLGYNVSDNRADTERQQLLIALLENKKITYLDMVKCIENNIRFHPNNPLAIAKWKRDLKYIGEHVLAVKVPGNDSDM